MCTAARSRLASAAVCTCAVLIVVSTAGDHCAAQSPQFAPSGPTLVAPQQVPPAGPTVVHRLPPVNCGARVYVARSGPALPAANAAGAWQPQPEPVPLAGPIMPPGDTDPPTASFLPGPIEPEVPLDDGGYGDSDSYGVDSGDGNGDGYGGFQFGFWGWLSYLRTPQRDQSTFWAWEFELDVTKSFGDGLAATAEVEFVDLPEYEAYVEQLFLSIVWPGTEDTILTAGKFNTPFGIEPRDFWNWTSASTSLIYRALPQDVVGLMLTHPLGDSGFILRPMVVNDFTGYGLDNNEQPSLAVMSEYKPSDDFSIAATNWWGPELTDNVGDKLYFADAQARWFVIPPLMLAGEYLYGTTASPAGRRNWQGFLALANYDLSENFRVFVQYSLLNDKDGFQTGIAERRREINFGFGWYLHPMVEVRCEYRNDDRPISGDRDHWDAHIAFGY